MTKEDMIAQEVYAKYPQWWAKMPKSDQEHQHISQELVGQFLKGKSRGTRDELERCVKMFAGCKECWGRWKQGYNSLLSGKLSILGCGSIEYGGSEKRFK